MLARRERCAHHVDLGVQAVLRQRHDLVRLAERRQAHQQHVCVDPGVAQTPHVGQTRLGKLGNAAGQDGARDLRLAAAALGHAGDLDASGGTHGNDGRGVAANAFAVDLYARHLSPGKKSLIVALHLLMSPISGDHTGGRVLPVRDRGRPAAVFAAAKLLACTVGRGRSILPALRPTGYGRHVNRVADVKPHDHRRAAFSGGKFHDF